MATEIVNAMTFRMEDGEDINVSIYGSFNGIPVNLPYDFATISEKSFGYQFNETKIKAIKFLGKRIDYIAFDMNTSINYSVDGTKLKRDLNYTITKKNQIGQNEEREVFRYIDFGAIMGKPDNLYNISSKIINISVCLNSTDINSEFCSEEINVSINKVIYEPRNISIEFIKTSKNTWSVRFYNIFDLDPSFIDDADSDWSSGTQFSFPTQGTGGDANLTCTNISGYFASKVFDANSTSNFTNITIKTQAHYGIEIGRAFNDTNNAKNNFVNTSGLVLLMHFNNESDLGENNSLVRDFSPDVNKERTESERNNGTCSGNICPVYNFSNKNLGRASMDFDGSNDLINVAGPASKLGSAFTISMWINPDSTMGANDNFMGVWNEVDGWLFRNDNDVDRRLEFHVSNAAGSITTTSAILTTQQWQQVGVTYDGSIYRLYYNGNNVFTSGTGIGAPVNPGSMKIGGLQLAGFEFPGLMDELAIFNRTLRIDEIQNIYLRGAYRMNVSARTCDDSACAGETYTNIQPNNITAGYTIPLNLTTNRNVEYNITCSNFSAYGVSAIVNNVSIDYWTPVTIVTAINITCIDDFDRANSATIGSSSSTNCESNYSTPWSKVEVGLSSFSIDTNKLQEIIGVTGIGSKVEKVFNLSAISTNYNETIFRGQYIAGIPINLNIGVGKFNDTQGTILYNLTALGDAVSGVDFSDAKGQFKSQLASPFNVSVNFTGDSMFRNATVCFSDKTCVVRTVDNPTRNISGIQILNIYALAAGTVTVESINFTNGTNQLSIAAVSNPCTCPTSGDFNICDGNICNLTSICDIGGNKVRVCDGSGLLIQTGGGIRAGGCFIGNKSRFFTNQNLICSI